MSALKKRMTGLLQRKDSSASAPQTHLQSESITEEEVANASLSKLMEVWFKFGESSDHVGALSLVPDRAFESSAKAEEAAKIMRRKISSWSTEKPWELYNCIMLIGIFARHEQGHLFTANIDDRFVGTVGKILRDTREKSVHSRILLSETFSDFEKILAGHFDESQHQRAAQAVLQARWKDDAGIQRLMTLRQDPKNWTWAVQQQRSLARATQQWQPYQTQGQQSGPLQMPPPQAQGLPDVNELSERIREANTSATILEQTINANTADLGALFKDELFREFSARCDTARSSLQRYIDLIDSGDRSQRYDQDTVAEIVASHTRVGTVMTLRDRKQEAYNIQRSQSRSPAVVGSSSFSPPPGPLNGLNGRSPAQPVATRALNQAARLENPFDDSNELARAARSEQGLQPDTSPGVAAANAGSFNHNQAIAANMNSFNRNGAVDAHGSAEEHRVSAESEDQQRPRRYVF